MKSDCYRVDVILTVYNESLHFVTSAINSIIKQDYKGIRLIVVVDNPDYPFFDEIKRIYSKENVLLVKNAENVGLAKSLNRAISMCDAEFIARMDADDISEPGRISTQLAFMEREGLDICGTAMRLIDENDVISGSMVPPSIVDVSALRYRTICFHPTWLVRRRVYDSLKYNDLRYAQDVNFLHRAISLGFKVGNIDKALFLFRTRSKSRVSADKALQQYLFRKLSYERLTSGKDVSEEDIANITTTSANLRFKLMYTLFISGTQSSFIGTKVALIGIAALLHGYAREQLLYHLGLIK